MKRLTQKLYLLVMIVALLISTISCVRLTDYDPPVEEPSVEELGYETTDENGEDEAEYEDEAEEPIVCESEEDADEDDEVLDEEAYFDMIVAFDEFLHQEFLTVVTSHPLTFHDLLRYPENFGIADFIISWEEADNWWDSFQERYRQFTIFEREELTGEQRQSYDIVSWQFAALSKWYDNQFWYYQSRLKPAAGTHVMLPLLLSEYRFYSPQDIENYLFLLSEIGIPLQNALAWEETRIERGFHFSNAVIHELIATCNGFLMTGEGNLLIHSFRRRLMTVDFLSEEEIAYYLARNEEIVYGYVMPAYVELINGLEALLGVAEQEELGLAHFDSGREFYRLQLRNMGTDIEPAEWIVILTQWLDEIAWEYFALIDEYPHLFYYDDRVIFPFVSPEEFKTFLENEAAAYFPPLPDGTVYDIRRMDASISGFAAGFYLPPQIDNYRENVFYYNPNVAHNPSFMYTLMAHEGVPGHMLQFVTLYAGPLSNFRKTNTGGFTKYIEGWATHAHLFSLYFVDTSAENRRRMVLEDELTWVYYALVDVGVNYGGWSLEELTWQMRENLWFRDWQMGNFRWIYEEVVRNPFRMLPYATGLWEIRVLKQDMQERLGEDFTIRAFHETFLNLGPAPFPLIREWMQD